MFFWHTPLFGREHGRLVLHIGLPSTMSDEATMTYLSNMGFGGLSTVYIYSPQAPTQKVMDYINSLYKHHAKKPVLSLMPASN